VSNGPHIAGERLSARAECASGFGGFDVPELRTLLTGLVFGESPRCHDNRLWCIDMGAHEVIAVDLDGNRHRSSLASPRVHRPLIGCPTAVC
jgi:hypothetical protein